MKRFTFSLLDVFLVLIRHAITIALIFGPLFLAILICSVCVDYINTPLVTAWVTILMLGAYSIYLRSLCLRLDRFFSFITNPVKRKFQRYYETYLETKDFGSVQEEAKKFNEDFNECLTYIRDCERAYCLFLNKAFCGTDIFEENPVKKGPNIIRVHHCNRKTYNNAVERPFTSVCQHFHIEATHENLSLLEELYCKCIAAENGKEIIRKKKGVQNEILHKIPYLIRTFARQNILHVLELDYLRCRSLPLLEFRFDYKKPSSSAPNCFSVILDSHTIQRFMFFLADEIQKKEQVRRPLLSSNRIEEIKERGNYTCAICGISTKENENMWLEIDHIIPLSENGLSTDDNLQTICWKCKKARNIESASNLF